MKAVHEELIRRRAHEIWEQRGRPHGQEKEHWAQAETELLNAAPEIEVKAPAAPKKTRRATGTEDSPAQPAVAKTRGRPRGRTEAPGAR